MKKALLLAALMLAPLLPLAEAAGPEPRTWGPYNASVEVSTIALAREGTTIAAGLRAPTVQPPAAGGVPGLPQPSTTRVDTLLLDHESGFVRQFNVNAVAPDGRTMVAVSRDGTAIASLRRETVISGTGGTQQHQLQVHYARVPAGANFSAGAVFERAASLGPADVIQPLGIVMSDDGNRVAVLLHDAAGAMLRGWSASASSLDSAFEIRRAGTPRALAGSGDLTRVVIAGQFPQGNFTYGAALVFPFAQSDAIASHYETSANGTDVRAAAISRDGRTVALGTGSGQALIFHNAREALVSPLSITLGSGGLANLTMSEDGSRLASAVGTNLTVLDVAAEPRVLWTGAIAGGAISSVAMNRTGGLIVVGASGTGGGVFGFSDLDATTLWSIPGDTRAVAVNADGTRIAYAQRTAVSAARIPRTLTMDLSTGGKVAPTQTITTPGSMSVIVNLRNDGAALERVVFEDNSPDVSVEASVPIVSVRPGEIARTNLTVHVTSNLVGQRVFNVTARSLTSGAVDNVTLSVMPRPRLDVRLSLNVTDILAEAGRPSEFLVAIVNNGTGDAQVVLNATQTVSSGPMWDMSLTETTLTALRGTRTSVKVTVTPPATAPNGTSSFITLRLVGTDIFDNARVSLRINPELKVEVNATGVTKLIEPGRRATYNVTVTNIGSLPRDFDVFWTITASDNRNWGVDMPTQVVRLEPNQRRVFPVAVIAPADALPNERVAVRISARSIPEIQNETVVEGNVTLYGIAVEPKVTTTTTPSNGIPFVAPAAILFAFLLAALLPRRRRS